MKVILFIYLILTYQSYAVDPPPKPADKKTEKKEGDAKEGEGEAPGFYAFEESILEANLLFGISMADVLPELEHVISTYQVIVGKTLSPGHTAEFRLLMANNEDIKITSFGLNYRPYFPMDLVAPFGNTGFQYHTFDSSAFTGTKKNETNGAVTSFVLGGGVLIPFSTSFYGRMGIDFFFNPGTMMTLGGGLSLAW